MDSTPGETADSLISSATAYGQTVTPAMLKQWRDAGLLPRPVQRGLGRERGSVAIYPAGTTAQLRRVLDIRAEDGAAGRRFNPDAAFWRLWWEGWPVEPHQVTSRLAETFAGWERALSAFADDDGSLTDAFRTARLPPLLARARKRVGTSEMDRVAVLILGSLAGDALPWWQDGDDDARTLLTGLGLDGAVRSLGPEAPRFTADLAGTLHRFGQVVSPDALRVAVTDAAPGDIDQARTDLRSIIGAARIVWNVAEVLLSASDNASNTGRDLLAVSERDGFDFLPGATLYMLALRRNITYARFLDTMRCASEMEKAIRAQQ